MTCLVRRVLPGMLLTLLASLPGATALAAGNSEYVVANLSDSELIEYVRALEAEPAPRADASGSAAICLLRELVMSLEQREYRILRNLVFRIDDPERTGVAERETELWWKYEIKVHGAWLLRDGKIRRLDRDHVKILKGDETRSTKVMVAFPDVQPGDVIGWSYEYGLKQQYRGRTERLWDPVPVRLARIRLMTDGWLAYRIVGRNLRKGSYDLQILEEEHASPTHTLATFHDLDPVVAEPYPAPPMAAEPVVVVSYRGYLSNRINRWVYIASWNEAAVWLEEELEDLMESDGELKKEARRLTQDLGSPAAKLEALYRFVRDEILPVAGWEQDSPLRPAKDVLASRTANGFEAGVLLCAMGRAVDLPVRPVFARSLDYGPLDEGNPSGDQYGDLLVELTDQPGRYYAPACPECPAGELPPDLCGAPAMTLRENLAERERKIREDVYSSTLDARLLMNKYDNTVAKQQWTDRFSLPGNPAAVRGVLAETIRRTGFDDQATLELKAWGVTDLGAPDQAAAATDRDVADYLAGRFPGATLTGPVGVEALGDTTRVTVPIRAALTPPAGDTWLLGAEEIFGGGFLPDWENADRGPFHLVDTDDVVRSWRMTLPDGWRLESAPQPLTVNNARFIVRMLAKIENGELIVSRLYRLRRGTTSRDYLADLDAAIGRVRAFERTPVVLVRTQ